MLRKTIPPHVCSVVSVQPHDKDGESTPRAVAKTVTHGCFRVLVRSNEGHVAHLCHDAYSPGMEVNFQPAGFHKGIPVTATSNATTDHVGVFRQMCFYF